jgi:beta-glucosidase
MASESPENLKNLPFMNENLDLEARVEDLLKRLTFEEKCLLSAGHSENSPPPIERLGIPKFKMTDGPAGVSPGAVESSPYYAESSGVAASTAFPTGIQMASSFDPQLLYKFGQAIAEETRAAGRCMILGPAFNLCRTPMNGRTFEYYSEDPYLSGELAVEAVKGIQSKRIAPCIKHYTANNNESNRFKVNVVVDERTLQELYLRPFKRCVQGADPWGLMSSYNKINGIYVSEHKEILRSKLKEEWGYSGVVVSDWGATNHVTGIKGLVEAGLDIEMGSRKIYQVADMIAMKEAGQFPEAAFEDNIRRILRAYFRTGCFDSPDKIPPGSLNTKEHQALARKMAEEGMILLKNEKNLLPLDINKIKKVAILGKHADTKFFRRVLGGGSSAVLPPYEITVRQGITDKGKGKFEIVSNPAEADVAIVCVGLDHSHDFKGGDHEGSDKLRYDLGYLMPKLINKTVAQNPNTIVVCINGSPFGMEKFVNNVPAILEAWYGGMEVGHVVADILFGDVNPSGKLPVSWPKKLKDIHTRLSFFETILPVKEIVYKEGVFIGYRYYETNNIETRYCFGHGLSYTKFDYSNLKLSSEKMKGESKLEVQFEIKNIGDRAGDEIAQLYLSDLKASVPRPVRELKGFKRVSLKPGESTTIKLDLTKEALAFFDNASNKWIAEDGEFEVQVGASVKDIRLKKKFSYSN